MSTPIRRFDAPTRFSSADSGTEQRRVRAGAEKVPETLVEDAGESVVEKARREMQERNEAAWRKSSGTRGATLVANEDANEGPVEKAQREMQERNINAWKPTV